VDFGSDGALIDTTVWDPRSNGCTVGEQSAAYIAERNPGAEVLVIGGPPVPAITHNRDCFVAAAKAAGLKVVAQEDNVKDTAASAQPIVENMLTKHRDIGAIWCFNEPSCLGAGAVLQGA